MATCADIIGVARYTLNDTDIDGYRAEDPELLRYLNDGLALAYQLRPDLLFPDWTTPRPDLTLTDVFPLPRQHQAAIANYIIARAESKDDEHIDSGRVVAMSQAFEQAIMRT